MYNRIYSWFSSFVKTHYSDDPFIMENILLKERHSYRVSGLARQIALSINLCESEVSLAELIGLLHDTGRFPQFSQYRTFRDNLSVNHAEMGLLTLKEHAVLESIPDEERNIILSAIYNHNALHIDYSMPANTLAHARIVRDADKLDIIPIMLDYYTKRESEPNTSLELSFDDTPGYNMEIVNRILRSENIPNCMRKNYNDLMLTQLSWLLDLNFSFSYTYVIEHQFPSKLQTFLPYDSTICEVFDHVIKLCIKRSAD